MVDANVISIMQNAIDKLELKVQVAQATGNEAKAANTSHEELCALRYEMIGQQLKLLPKMFEKIDGVVARVNIATGVWAGAMGVGAVVAIVTGIVHLVRG